MRASEFLIETVEEVQEIKILTQLLVDKVTALWNQGRKDTKPIPMKLLNLPQFKSPAINKLIQNAKIRIFDYWPGGTKGAWAGHDSTISLRVDLKDNPKEMFSTISHELTHAVDTYKGIDLSKTRVNPNDDEYTGDKGDYEGYLKSRHEVDARLTQALMDLDKEIAWQKEIDELFSNPGDITPRENAFLTRAIKGVFTKHRIAEVFPQGVQDPKYRRLINRAYKYYTAPNMAVSVATPGFLGRAKNWIVQGLLAKNVL